ncbi:cAMP-activated global transcriptional regulator CRP [Endozoicomonas lisbonensis]|uniref:CRP/FNR family cyclic AMP-dependent transcriptional regulator n=1 Tax=Endozoicomonas lisbonensis TaxID=3120522 RepID=A0ABV2SE19_9GAMM
MTMIAQSDSRMDKFLSVGKRKNYRPRSTILCAGEASSSIYYIIQGTVSVVIEDTDGREMIVTYLNPGQYFGEMGLFDEEFDKQSDEKFGENRAPRSAWIKARSACEVVEVSYDQFYGLIKEDPGLLLVLSGQLVNRLKETTQKVGDLAFLDVSGRVARTLLDLCKQPDAMTHPDGMQIKITRQEIGRIVGCSREMVGRVLKDLEAQGLISVKGKTMVVFGTR